MISAASLVERFCFSSLTCTSFSRPPSFLALPPSLQIYTQWVDAKNYVDVTRRWYAEHTPFPLNFLLPNRMHSRQIERLRLIRGDAILEPEEQLEKEVRGRGDP